MQDMRQRGGVGWQRLFEAAASSLPMVTRKRSAVTRMARTRPRSRMSSAAYCGWPFSWSVSPSSGVLASMTAASSFAAALRAARPGDGLAGTRCRRCQARSAIRCRRSRLRSRPRTFGSGRVAAPGIGLRPAGSAGGSGLSHGPDGRCAPARHRRFGRSAAVATCHVLRHRLQGGDAVFGARVGRKQIVHALAGQRIDDEEVRGRRIALGIRVADAFGAAGDLVKRRGKPERLCRRSRRRAGRPSIRACG